MKEIYKKENKNKKKKRREGKEEETDILHTGFKIISVEKTFVVFAPSLAEKKKWLEQFLTVLSKYKPNQIPNIKKKTKENKRKQKKTKENKR